MMTVYEIYDDNYPERRFIRNLREARREFASVKSGRLERITIPTPITKDTVIALLNQEGYAAESETIIERK